MLSAPIFALTAISSRLFPVNHSYATHAREAVGEASVPALRAKPWSMPVRWRPTQATSNRTLSSKQKPDSGSGSSPFANWMIPCSPLLFHLALPGQTGYDGTMNGEEQPRELQTEADDLPPLSNREAQAMGRQTETRTRGERISDEVVYGDVESVENEDQADAHHADPGEHL